MSADGEIRHEIVIVRRRSDHEDEGHHGAAWKIAYADFMTALMAFFLVMWLVNAASKKQVVEVAAYFNPIKLTDKVTAPKGVHKVELDAATEVPTDKMADTKKDGDDKAAPKAEAEKKGAGQSAVQDNLKKPASGESESRPAGSGPGAHDAGNDSRQQDAANDEMFRHPFEMLKRLAGEFDERKADNANQPFAGPNQTADFSKDPFEITERRSAVTDAPQVPAENVKGEASKVAVVINNPKSTGPAASPPVASGDRTDGQKLPAPGKEPSFAKKLESQVQAIIEAHKSEGLPALEVTKVQDGVLISLSDKADYAMFGVGSSVPQPALVRLLGDIGKVLAAAPGQVAVRGHTDARPYRSENYDNWRLSTSRAQTAYYMLVKGGLDEKRIVRVEGYADRVPKTPADPLAPGNRRIEVLLLEARQ